LREVSTAVFLTKTNRALLNGVALLVAFFAVRSTIAPAEEAVDRPWRSADRGGINALYCYLRVLGRDVGYADLQRAHAAEPVDSATPLLRLAARHSVTLAPVALTMAALTESPLPLLVHMDGETPESGAFLLLVNVTDEAVYYLNGPTASMHSMRREDFRRVWSGTALVPVRDRARALMAGGLGLGIGLLACRLLRRRRVFSKDPVPC
jgi:Peptidase C39 family